MDTKKKQAERVSRFGCGGNILCRDKGGQEMLLYPKRRVDISKLNCICILLYPFRKGHVHPALPHAC